MKKNYLLICLMLITILGCAQAPAWNWAKSAGGSYEDWAFALTTDISGRVIMAGSFESAGITFGVNNLTNMATDYTGDIFLVKYDVAGNVIWAKSNGGIYEDLAYAVTSDALGNIFVTGYFYSPVLVFGNCNLANTGGGSDMFLAKYDSLGNILWAKSAGGVTGDVVGNDVTVDAGGNVFVTGYYNSPVVDFTTSTLTNFHAGDCDMFLVKYDQNGNFLWAKSAGGNLDDNANSTSVDALGNVFVAGSFSSHAFICDADTLFFKTDTTENYTDVFLLKFDNTGNLSWAKCAGDSLEDVANSVCTDASGNVLIAGFFCSRIIFGFDTLNVLGSGFSDAFLAKYDTDGNEIWAKSAGGSFLNTANALITDASGNVFVAGNYTFPMIVFGLDTLTNTGSYDCFVAKYDPAGNVLWAKSADGGCDMIEQATSIACDVSGNVFLAGYFDCPSMVFGSDTIVNPGNFYDIFLAKLNDLTTNINEPAVNNDICLYPNPAQDFIIIEAPRKSKIEIYNLQGQLIKTFMNAGTRTTIDLGCLSGGFYAIKATTAEEIMVKKFFKQ